MRTLIKVLVIAAALLLLTGFILKNGKQPEPFPEGSESAQRLLAGSFTSAHYAHSFVDSSRLTQANGDFKGSDSRVLDANIWYPLENSGAPYPLIVYSHGFTSNKDEGAHLGEYLASHGYVVVAASYPLTNYAAPGGPLAPDVANQPGDISFMIDELLASSASAGHVLEGKVDANRIGAAGVSLGGLTSTLAAFHPLLADERIGAAISIAGPTALFTPDFFSHRDVPFLMIAGDIDAMIPYATNIAPLLDKAPATQLLRLSNGSHTGFAGPAELLRWLKNADALGCYMVSGSVTEDEDSRWDEFLGPAEVGIDYDMPNDLCLEPSLPKAMNIIRQLRITRVAVGSFFESQFAHSAEQRTAAANYLEQVISEELAEVSYTASQ